MITNFKDIHIGELIYLQVKENDVDIARICNFMKCTENDLTEMYESKNMHTNLLLKWSKLLEYDFFRLYSQHLILYSPPSGRSPQQKSSLPRFRKNVYTKEIIDFILELISKGEMTKQDVIERYAIPKTTLYKWIDKYKS